MLIGIDGNEANVKKRVGSNVFAFKILESIYEIFLKERKNKYLIYVKDKPLLDLPKEKKGWEYKVFGPKKFWTRLALPFRLFSQKEKIDVFFTPGHYSPLFCPCPLVITILDTSYLTFPDYFKKEDLYQLKKWTAESVRKAKKIITISENSKRDIIKFYKREPKEITVVYPGYDKKRYNKSVKDQESEIKKVKRKYKVSSNYIIYVGTLQPRKNLLRLIGAFKRLKREDLQLLIVGKKGWMYEKIFEKVKKSDLEKKIVFTGFVEDRDLPYLTAGAKIFVLPSLYEGFGIPVIEAKALGVVTVVSKNSSLVEIGGKGSIFIEEPKSEGSIEKALRKGLDLNKEERNEIIRKGLKEAEKYCWRKSAGRILNVLINLKG